jgi:hypothetical protein
LVDDVYYSSFAARQAVADIAVRTQPFVIDALNRKQIYGCVYTPARATMLQTLGFT